MGLKERAKQAAEMLREANERNRQKSADAIAAGRAQKAERAAKQGAAAPRVAQREAKASPADGEATTAKPAKAAVTLPPGALLQTKSHEQGRNSTVTLYPDRIERVKDRSFGSLSRAVQDAEVIPTKAVSSVQATKDGLAFTKVTVFASGNTIEFRMPHDAAQRFKEAITRLLLEPAPPPTAAPSPDVADQLTKLAALRDQGILTEEEFGAQKAKLLG
jgi:hypothetical protein